MTPVLKYCFGLPEVGFAAGDTLIIEGTERGPLYILVDGTIEVVRDGVQVAETDVPGSIFGEMSSLLDMPHSATVKAASDVRVHVIEQPAQFLESRPQIAIQVARLLAYRLDQATVYLVEAKRAHAGEESPLGEVTDKIASIVHSQDGVKSDGD